MSRAHRLTSQLFPYTTLFRSLGVGVGRVEVTLRDRSGASTTEAAPTFDEVAQAPGAESRMSGRHLLSAPGACATSSKVRSEEHTSELQSQFHLVCRLLLEKKN